MNATKPLTLTQVCLCPNLTFHDAESEYLRFEVTQPLMKRKTHMVEVYNVSGVPLGIVNFKPGWRQYVFEPAYDTVFNIGCLANIQRLLECMNKARRTKPEPI